MGMALGILKTTYFLHISEAQYLDKTDSMFINVGEQNMNRLVPVPVRQLDHDCIYEQMFLVSETPTVTCVSLLYPCLQKTPRCDVSHTHTLSFDLSLYISK